MRRKYALCVGINDYPGTGADLRGCVNDANDWADLLSDAGYRTTVLLDDEATKGAVLGHLRAIVDAARFSDRIALTYSGHGSFIPDHDGDETDGRDECLVLHDFRSGGLLTDDELHEVFAARRYGVRALVVSDSCHSGTMYRAVGAAGAPRFLPPSALGVDVATLPAPRGAKPRPTTALLSGCADTEYSYDAWIDGRPQGAFTAAALRTWQPGTNLRAWHQRIRGVLPSNDYPQTPQLGATESQRRWTL